MTEANDKGLYVGKQDLPLSPSGLAHLLQMKETFDYPSARKFYAAPQIRCRQTLEVLYPGCTVTDAAGLQECDFGDFEGRSAAQLKALWAEPASCGSGKIYDGTFSRTLIPGDGVTAALLKAHGITVFGESEIEKLI